MRIAAPGVLSRPFSSFASSAPLTRRLKSGAGTPLPPERERQVDDVLSSLLPLSLVLHSVSVCTISQQTVPLRPTQPFALHASSSARRHLPATPSALTCPPPFSTRLRPFSSSGTMSPHLPFKQVRPHATPRPGDRWGELTQQLPGRGQSP